MDSGRHSREGDTSLESPRFDTKHVPWVQRRQGRPEGLGQRHGADTTRRGAYLRLKTEIRLGSRGVHESARVASSPARPLASTSA